MKNALAAAGGFERPPLSWQLRLALVAGLTVLAIIADWFAPTIFAGHSLVLGVVFYWMALRLVGPNHAVIVLLISTGILSVKWSQPYSGSIIALEGLWVGWAWRRHINPLVADLVFWILVGTPLSWFFYNHVYLIPHPSLEHALGVQPINGLIAIWIAYMLMELLESSNSFRGFGDTQTFRSFLLKRYIAFGTFPVLVAGLLAARSFEQRALLEARQNLTTTAQRLAADLGSQIAAGTTIVREVAARQSDRAWFHDEPRLSTELEAARSRSGLFVTMLAADSTGLVIGASDRPVSPPPAARPAPIMVADRSYFIEPMTRGRPFVSGVFRGRGFGRDLLVAVSAPVFDHSGEKLGIVEGSLKVNSLADLVRGQTPGETWRVLLCDRQQLVIASQGFQLRPLSALKGSPLGRLTGRAPQSTARFTDDTGPSKISYLSISVLVPNTDWTLTVQREWGDVLHPVIVAYAWMLLVAIVTAAFASLFAAWSIRDLIVTWRNLITFSRAPNEQLGLLDHSQSLKLPQEFHELLRNLSEMAHRLVSEQSQREKLLAELESRVKARTSELQHALIAAQSADRTKSAFLATVSHELRTPLTSIITGVGLLKLSRTPKSELEIRTLTTLEKSSQALMAVISDVLDYSKLEAGAVTIERAPFNPAQIITDIVAILTPAAQRANLTLQVIAHTPADSTWTGDAQRIRQVVLNLGGNSVKFTSSGQVEFRSAILDADPAAGLPRRLYFSVQDTGPGIAPEKLHTIFDAFVQLKNNRVMSQAGTGLGLTISRKLVEMMGGKITVSSQVGAGSRFEFWIPEAPAADPGGPAAAPR